MTKGLRSWGIAALAIVIAAVLAAAFLYAFPTPKHFIALGRTVFQDDFAYTVTGVGRTPEISNAAGRAAAKGEFYIVTIRVDNNARRAAFVWDERIPRVVDAQGHRYLVSPRGQAVLDASLRPRFAIEPGASETFEAVFDVPREIRQPALVFDNGVLAGDVLNLAAYRRIGVKLY